MKAYVTVAGGVPIKAVGGQQGFLTDLTRLPLWSIVTRKAAGLPDGTYRMTVGFDPCVMVRINTRPIDVAKEATMLLAKRYGRASTNMPGVQGYQQRADASTVRLMTLESEMHRLGQWLANVTAENLARG
jgi:hypothetical protein